VNSQKYNVTAEIGTLDKKLWFEILVRSAK